MFGTEILDVAIGLIFFYLVLSLVVTAANELFAAWFKRRSWMLWKGVKNLLQDDALTVQLYNHPLIKSLRQPNSRPSYIPSRTFALALLDVAAPRQNGKRVLPPKGSANSHLAQSLSLLWDEADGDDEKLKRNIEVWFNNSMERVSGWYKRRTQFLLLLWAVFVTIGANADTLVIANTLWRDPVLRASLVAQAERYVEERRPAAASPEDTTATDGPPPLPPYEQADTDFEAASERFDNSLTQLRELKLPIGWKTPSNVSEATLGPIAPLTVDQSVDVWPGVIWPLTNRAAWGRWLAAFDQHKFGWLLTILAVSLGAPFWFDMLNKVMSIRAVGKAPEEKQKRPKTVPRPKEPGEKAP